MPGSPPSSVTEPWTKPPPVTRSNSAMPVTMRGAAWPSPDSPSSAKARPRWALIAVGGPASSSTMLFHSWQELQRPCHRLVTAPQFWQTKVERDLAMAVLMEGARKRRLARFPLGRNHPSDKKSRKNKMLEQVPSQKSVNFRGTCSSAPQQHRPRGLVERSLRRRAHFSGPRQPIRDERIVDCSGHR